MSFQYKNVLVIGATSGIGLALAEKMIQAGAHVIAVGRRQENLDSFVKKHGDKASSIRFDITDLKGIPDFAERVTKSYPNLDSILLNSGIQRPLDFTKPSSIDLDAVSTEFTTNYLSYVHLTAAFLPFLQEKSTPSSLIYVTSGLALTPIPRCGNYCASKAALHSLILTMREQLSGSSPNIKIMEILPPAVQTELHDAKHQPDIKNGGNIGMPLKDFTDEAWAGLSEGKENIPVGMAKERYEQFEIKKLEVMKKMWAAFASGGKP